MDEARPISKSLQRPLDEFLRHLRLERGLADNSVSSYQSDLNRFIEYLSEESIGSFDAVTTQTITDFLALLSELGLTASSRARYSSAIKGLYKYLNAVAHLASNPAEQIELSRTGRPLPEALTIAEVQKMLSEVDLDRSAGVRDRSILETLYACGLRVSELINLRQRGAFLVHHHDSSYRTFRRGARRASRRFARHRHRGRLQALQDG